MSALGLFVPPSGQRAQQLFQQGWAAQGAGRLQEALKTYQEVLKLNPKHFDALHVGGAVALQLGEPQLALELMNRALKIHRDHPGVLLNRGAVYADLGDWDLALLNVNKVIALEPQNAKAYNNRGNIHRKRQHLQAALADYEHALTLEPLHYSAQNNVGNVLADLGRHAEGIAALDKALALMPQSVEAHWNQGMLCLRVGDFARGWAESEWRLHFHANLGLRASYPQPRWQGEPLEGKTLLVCAEQGLGDSIQFSRYLPALVAQGAQVIFEVQAPLIPLLPELPGVRLIPQGGELQPHDLYVPLLSLPLHAHTDLGNIPLPLPGFQVPPELVQAWQARLGTKRKPRIGVAWSGNPGHVDDHKRSIPLADMLGWMSPDFEWVSLHKEVRPSDQAALDSRPDVRFFGEHLNSYADTAALCQCLDLVISVDTSVVHLAASLGLPTWVLIAFAPDWRWLLGRDDNPWYPSVRVWRQAQANDWGSVFAPLQQALAQRASAQPG